MQLAKAIQMKNDLFNMDCAQLGLMNNQLGKRVRMLSLNLEKHGLNGIMQMQINI